jgi:hypothetical protein
MAACGRAFVRPQTRTYLVRLAGKEQAVILLLQQLASGISIGAIYALLL